MGSDKVLVDLENTIKHMDASFKNREVGYPIAVERVLFYLEELKALAKSEHQERIANGLYILAKSCEHKTIAWILLMASKDLGRDIGNPAA